ncbi:MAG: hypothetical protein V3S24_22245, partial [Candidatus Tectomicrobia bacterium]
MFMVYCHYPLKTGISHITGIMQQSPPIPGFRTIGLKLGHASQMEFTEIMRQRSPFLKFRPICPSLGGASGR